MKNKPTETIRSFFGEHQRRISFQAPVVISFQEKLRKEIALSFSTKEQIRKILQSLLESTFPHKNLNEAVDLIETIAADGCQTADNSESAPLKPKWLCSACTHTAGLGCDLACLH